MPATWTSVVLMVWTHFAFAHSAVSWTASFEWIRGKSDASVAGLPFS